MKKLLMLLAAAALVVGMATLVSAADEHTVTGKVVSIDSEGKAVVIDTTGGQKTLVLQETTKGVEGLKPGMEVEMTCIDVGGKACVKDVRVISVEEASRPTQTVEGEVVSIDSEGKAVVIKTPKGKEMTITIKEQPAVEKMTVQEAAPAGEQVAVEPTTLSELKAGAKVRVDCFDSEGKFCVKKVTVVPAGPLTAMELTGRVVSIDSEGKAVVVETEAGQKTLYYQKATAGAPLSDLEVGKNVRAYCIDVAGKACIKDINVAE